MSDAVPTLELSRCEACHHRYVPTDGPCPKCGAARAQPYPVPDAGRVVAVTELAYPAPGWPAPHRLALLEVADGVRLLGVIDGPAPPVGAPVRVRLDGATYRVRADEASPSERGEGESPRARRRGPSFEPPR